MAPKPAARRLPWTLASLLAAALALPAAPPPLTAEEVRWLDRITYGIDSDTVQRYRTLGRRRFLEQQLRPEGLQPPPAVATALAGLTVTRKSAEDYLREVDAENRRIQALPDDAARQQARQAQNQAASAVAAEAARAHLLRALWSPAQVQEQMVWFWLNHFSVFQGKASLRWTVADYEARAVRPHALGRFRDLVRATLLHPAMLVYLDNAPNAAGRLNENLARELLELHTLGVDGGYTQADVQEVARVLTGAGLAPAGGPPRLKPEWRDLYLQEGAFAFNPARHDFGDKVVLGRPVQGRGFAEIEEVVDRVAAHPATAVFVCRKLAVYWLGGPPPEALVQDLAGVFRRSGGEIPAVLRALFAAPAFQASLGRAFKDPMHFVASALRLAYDGRQPLNMRPVAGWLNALGQPLFGHVTPDGHPLAPEAWTSPGQLARRFDIARAIGGGPAGLFDGEDGRPGPAPGFPRPAARLYYDSLEGLLSEPTRRALEQAASQAEWNTLLLASPDFMAR